MKITVVGAGAAGLMAAYILSQQGHEIIILEAQGHLGGRIHTIDILGFNTRVETGAEFIHGNLPVTTELLKQAKIKYTKEGGDFWNANSGKLVHGFEGMSNWHELEEALTKVEADMSIDHFLGTYLGTKEQVGLKAFVKSYVQGYDAADTSRMSTIAFRDELMNDDEEHQYRIDGGYQSLIDYLAKKCGEKGCEILTSSIVSDIKWNRGKAEVITNKKETYISEKVIITIPAGVLQANEGEGIIRFYPGIPGKKKEIQTIGYGNAMKIFLQFKREFWKQDDYVKRYGKKIKELGFIVSGASVPVWWTQYPNECGMLTGWLGGVNTAKFELSKESEILDSAIESVAHIFGASKQEIETELKTSKIVDWAKKSFTRGAYTYPTVESNKIGEVLFLPVENTLYFSGEAFYNGPSKGTVEAALASGKKTAELILQESN
jgi:monoamine oxidase